MQSALEGKEGGEINPRPLRVLRFGVVDRARLHDVGRRLVGRFGRRDRRAKRERVAADVAQNAVIREKLCTRTEIALRRFGVKRVAPLELRSVEFAGRGAFRGFGE